MRIAWHMPTLRRGACGLSVRARHLALGLRAAGHEVTWIVAANKTNVVGNDLDGLLLVRIEAEGEPPIHWSLQAVARRRAARACVRALDVRHELMLTCQPEFAFEYAAANPARPVVFVCGGSNLLHEPADRVRRMEGPLWRRPSFILDGILKRRNEARAFRAATRVVFDSRSTRRRVIERFGLEAARCHAVLGGVDAARFTPPTPAERQAARRAMSVQPHERVAAWTGRMSPEKNVLLLLRALTLSRHAAMTLLLAGDGPERELLRQRARILGLTARVRFLGELDNVLPALHAADLFVFPSTGESFGGALAEAMAVGLPCIALRPDGRTVRNACDEIIVHDVSGLLVDTPDPRAIAEAMDNCAEDPSLARRLGEAARRRAVECFSWRGAAQALNEILNQLIHRIQPGMTSTATREAPILAEQAIA